MKFSDPKAVSEFTRPFAFYQRNKSTRLDDAVNGVYRRWPNILPDLDKDDELKILQRMATCHKRKDWEGATNTDILAAARAAFKYEKINDKRYTPFREFLILELATTNLPGLRRLMFNVYISSFKPKAAHTVGLAEALDVCQKKLGTSEKKLIDSLPEILDARDGPTLIAQRLIEESNPQEALDDWGLKENYDIGLMYFIHVSLVRFFKSLLAEEDSYELNRFFGWLKPDNAEPRQIGAGIAIDAVLGAWLKRNPEAEYQAAIISGLVAIYGDPRVSQTAAWSEASGSSLGIIHRWLTGETMSIFLKAISNTNDEAMWANRRAFWMDLYDDGHIDEAWVAFSDRAYAAAQNMAQTVYERDLHAGFGRQIARGRPNTSLLVMRIGSRIIVEGSHSYMVQLFEPSNPNCPKLYEKSYNCESIRTTSDDSKPHIAQSWQRWVRQKAL